MGAGEEGGDGVGCGVGLGDGCGVGWGCGVGRGDGCVGGPLGAGVAGIAGPLDGAVSTTGANGFAEASGEAARLAGVARPAGAPKPGTNGDATDRSCEGGSAPAEDAAGCLTSSAWRQKCADTPEPTPTTVAQRKASPICFTPLSIAAKQDVRESRCLRLHADDTILSLPLRAVECEVG